MRLNFVLFNRIFTSTFTYKTFIYSTITNTVKYDIEVNILLMVIIRRKKLFEFFLFLLCVVLWRCYRVFWLLSHFYTLISNTFKYFASYLGVKLLGRQMLLHLSKLNNHWSLKRKKEMCTCLQNVVPIPQ